MFLLNDHLNEVEELCSETTTIDLSDQLESYSITILSDPIPNDAITVTIN